MLIDLLCVVLVLLLGYLGWRRGLVRSLLPLVGLAVAYAAAWLLHRPAGRLAGDLFELQPLLSYPLGGALVFVLTLVSFGLLGLALRRRRRRPRQPRKRLITVLDRAGGAVLGGIYGTALVLVAAWGLLSLQALAGPEGFGPDMRQTRAGQLALPLAERAARRVAGGETGNPTVASAAASFARDPARTTRDIAGVLGDRRVQAVLNNRGLMRKIARNPQQAAQSDALQALARDPEMVKRLQRVGLVQPAEAGGQLSPREVQRQLTARLRPAARLASTLARDPEVRALLEDRELQHRLAQRDLLALANDPKFNRLAEIVVERLRTASQEASTP